MTNEFMREPARFIQICQKVSKGSTFMIVPTHFENINQSVFKTDLPLWFNPNHFNSLAMWIIMILERSIYMHFNTFEKKIAKYGELKQMWVQPDSRLIMFKHEIQPYWIELIQKIQSEKTDGSVVIEVYQELEHTARQ